MALENIILEDLEQGRPVYIVGAEGDVRNRLRKLGLLDAVTAERVVASRQEALELANADLDARQTADEATAPA
jgi:SulP family sulfate permease